MKAQHDPKNKMDNCTLTLNENATAAPIDRDAIKYPNGAFESNGNLVKSN